MVGSIGRPANTPSGTVDHGGRAVVDPTSSRLCPVSRAISRIEGSWHIRPWQGPIVTVVNRLHSSIESYPSSTLRRMSLAVTSSQKQTNDLLAPSDAGGTATDQLSAS